MKISVITATYNCAASVRATISSVLAQDWPDLEYIVVDGASTDGTVDVVKEFGDRISVFVSEPDSGVYDAMNKGLELASGEWCAFMNAGDVYSGPGVISAMFADTELLSGKKVVYGNTEYVYPDGRSVLHPTADLKGLGRMMSKYQPYSHQAVFYSISDKSDCRYDLRYRICADYDVACRYWKRYGAGAYHYVPVTVCRYKAYDGISSKPENLRKTHREMLLVKLSNHMSPLETAKDALRLLLHIDSK